MPKYKECHYITILYLHKMSTIPYLRSREHIETKRSTKILFILFIPVKSTYSNLECYKLLDCVFKFLISLLYCVIIMWFIIHRNRMPYKIVTKSESYLELDLPENSVSIAIKSEV